MKKVAILGSTGSIGTQTLDVIKRNADRFLVASLVANTNEQLLKSQVEQFSVPYSALIGRDGEQCLVEAVKNCDIVVVATRGIVALEAVLYCIKNNIDVALANKETLICGGQLINNALKTSKSKLIPVDSEHSAIFQCLNNTHNKPNKLYLTASGGAFWNFGNADFANATADLALKHPNWQMGQKITVDSATMMNKTFEVLEAAWLFDMKVDDIEIVVHRQSIVHSLVQFDDGSVLAQLSNPDMRLPIQYALTYPQRIECDIKQLDLTSIQCLTFDKCDFQRFPCAGFAYEICHSHPLLATVLNSANDVCVEYYIQGKLKFLDFYSSIQRVLNEYKNQLSNCKIDVHTIGQLDKKVKAFTTNFLNGEIN